MLVSCPAAESSGKNGAGGDKIRSISEVKAYFGRAQSEKHNAAFGGVSGGKRYEKSAAKMRARYAALKEKYPDISRAIDAETEMSATKGIALLHGETQAGAKPAAVMEVHFKRGERHGRNGDTNAVRHL